MTDRIKRGIKVEISDVLHPYKLWVATVRTRNEKFNKFSTRLESIHMFEDSISTKRSRPLLIFQIIENVGGRLLLRYETPSSSRADFWIFCTSERLHSYGFTSKSDSKWFLEPPGSIIDLHTYEEWKDLLESKPKECQLAEELFDNDANHRRHSFQVGIKLETLIPTDRTKICPATVSKVLDDTHFLVTIDAHSENSNSSDDTIASNMSETNTWLCTAEHPYIFPIGWAKKNNVT